MSRYDRGPAITLPTAGDRRWPNPLRLLVSQAPWKAALFLAGYLLVSGLLAGISLVAVSTGAVFAVTLAGLPVLIVASGAVRFAAGVERVRLGPVLAAPLESGYREPGKPGVIAMARTRWRDPATWRELAYLIGLWVPLAALDLGVLVVWVVLASLVVVPAWYHFPVQTFTHGASVHGVQLGYFPNGPHGPGGHGVYITTLSQALAVAACALVAFILFNYVLVATARMHAVVARNLLRPPADPLAAARGVLAGPRPLGPLQTD
jgi:hypothetical protein